jgi:hypothetical protein
MPDTLRLAGALVAPHSHQESDLLDGDLYARLAASETVAGLWGFPAAGIKIGQEALSSPAEGVLAVGGDLQVGGSIRLGEGPLLSPGASGDDLFLTGDLDVSGNAAIGNLASIDSRKGLRIQMNTGDCGLTGEVNCGAGLYIRPVFNTTTQGFGFGLTGEIEHTGTAGASFMLALGFNCIQNGSGSLSWMHGVQVNLISYVGAGTLGQCNGLHVIPDFQGNKPSTFRGLYVQGHSGMSTVYGVRVEDFTGATIRLLEIGPATPYLRLVGGAAPAANQTNLYLYEGSTPALRQVQWKAGNALGAGDKVLVLV